MSPSARGGFGARLLLAQLLVVLVGTSTLLIVALGLAPGLFRSHVERAAGPIAPELASHLATAFTQAMLVSLAVATIAATLTAVGVGVLVTRRAVRPIHELALAASAVAHGDYSVQLRSTGLGAEFDTVNGAFTSMARHIAAPSARAGRCFATSCTSSAPR